MSKDLSGQVALVTGASRGIGEAAAYAFANAGANVALVARSTEDIAEIAGKIEMHDRPIDRKIYNHTYYRKDDAESFLNFLGDPSKFSRKWTLNVTKDMSRSFMEILFTRVFRRNPGLHMVIIDSFFKTNIQLMG